MTSPSRDPPVLSSSPTSMRGCSPVRRRENRENSSQTDVTEAISRQRHSPTLVRSYDPNDPDARERQRTMDVDMALHLSRARRETITVSPVISPYEPAPRQTEHPESTFPSLSVHEEREIDYARGQFHPVGHDLVNGRLDDEHIHTRVTPVDFGMHHLDQGHDPSLLATLGGQLPNTDHEDPASMSGLPTYQANVSRS
ncbi:hypothetical protein SERLADRAFT_461705, partial [Serpula lacrymans var. lacrymans S7.9]